MIRPTLAGEILAAARGLLDAAIDHDPGLAGSEIGAIGWGTVELDRAERELGVLASVGAGRDSGLGATARVGPTIDGIPLVLLEPDTEGRLAAILARHGEGVAAAYVRTPAGGQLVIAPATSAPGGRPPTTFAGRPPSATG